MEGNEMNELRELVEFLKQNGIAEFEQEREGNKLRIRFAGVETAAASGVDLARLAQLVGSGAAPGAVAAAPAATPASQPAASAEPTGHVVKSPIVGTFYESPSPGSPAFVKVGDRVEAGQVLCIVEAMKLMNEIESDVSGEIVRIIATSGQPVEYGQPLFEIKQ